MTQIYCTVGIWSDGAGGMVLGLRSERHNHRLSDRFGRTTFLATGDPEHGIDYVPSDVKGARMVSPTSYGYAYDQIQVRATPHLCGVGELFLTDPIEVRVDIHAHGFSIQPFIPKWQSRRGGERDLVSNNPHKNLPKLSADQLREKRRIADQAYAKAKAEVTRRRLAAYERRGSA